MGLLDRVSAARGQLARDERRFGIDPWIGDYLIPSSFQYGGQIYPFGTPFGLTQTLAGNRATEIVQSLPGYMAALRACPPAFGAQMVRALILSQARFTFRNPPYHPRTPRRTFGSGALAPLERPWQGATTGELLARMEWHAGLAGNAFVVRRPDRLRVLRPDWVALVYGSELEPDNPGHALDGKLLGYLYVNGGFGGGGSTWDTASGDFGYKPTLLLPDEVAHWSPLPDPLNAGIGMSWLTPGIRDMQGDRLAAEHKIKFFENGATPNLVVKGIPAVDKPQFDQMVEMMEEKHAGVANAYKTLYLTAGADATVIGSNLAEIDFRETIGMGETRLSVLSRVPASLLGIADGLTGSSLNEGNFNAARRTFGDTWVYPTLQDVAAALAPLVNVPSDAELWFDAADIPLLKEDAKDAAEIEQIKAATIEMHIRSGFTPESAVAAVLGQNQSLLVHTGLQSIQMQAPAPDAGRVAMLLSKAQAAQILVNTGFTPESAVAAVDDFDVTQLVVGELVPKVLIEDPTVAGAEPGVPSFPAGPDATIPAVPAKPAPPPAPTGGP